MTYYSAAPLRVLTMNSAFGRKLVINQQSVYEYKQTRGQSNCCYFMSTSYTDLRIRHKKNYSTFLFQLGQVAIAPKASRSFDNFYSLYHKTLYSMYTTHVLRSLTSFSLRVAYLQLFFVIHERLWFDVPRIRGDAGEEGIICILHIRNAYNSDITVIFSGGTHD